MCCRVASAGFAGASSGNLTFSCDFEGGNIGFARAADNGLEYDINVRQDTFGHKHRLWFHFQMRGGLQGAALPPPSPTPPPPHPSHPHPCPCLLAFPHATIFATRALHTVKRVGGCILHWVQQIWAACCAYSHASNKAAIGDINTCGLAVSCMPDCT